MDNLYRSLGGGFIFSRADKKGQGKKGQGSHFGIYLDT